MMFIAKKALNTTAGIIMPGKRVSASYPRLAEALKRGWVEEVNPPVPDIIDGKQYFEGGEVYVEDVMPVEEPIAVVAPETYEVVAPVQVSKAVPDFPLSELPWLASPDLAHLTEAGVIMISDIEPYDEDALCAVRGIGKKKAKQLIEAHKDWLAKGDNEYAAPL